MRNMSCHTKTKQTFYLVGGVALSALHHPQSRDAHLHQHREDFAYTIAECGCHSALLSSRRDGRDRPSLLLGSTGQKMAFSTASPSSLGATSSIIHVIAI